MNTLISKNGFDRVKTSNIVGDHISWSQRYWCRARVEIDGSGKYVVLMETAEAGSVLWEGGRIIDIQSDPIIIAGISPVLADYKPYTAVQLLDENGLICTFTASAWGGRNAFEALIPQYRTRGKNSFPIVTLGSRPRNNEFGTIDPVFNIVGWSPRSNFEAILGPEPVVELAPALPAPEPPKTLKQRAASEIIDDDLPDF